VIDVLAMLQEKTRGNLQPEEQSTLDNLISELKLIWVQAQGGGKSA
jgi:hypothetical protein